MGRSKFPGKPSKHVNRKRVNVLPASTNATSVEHSAVTVDTNEEAQQGTDDGDVQKPEFDAFAVPELPICQRVPKRRTKKNINKTKRKLVTGRKNVKGKHKNIKKSGQKRIRKSVRDFSTGRTLVKTRSSIETSKMVGKFVLPTRSVHSSRVIKPNKRFINMELSESRTFKKRKRLPIKSDDGKVKVLKSKCLLKERKTPERDPLSQASGSNSRVVLRQARLKLHTQTPIGPEGPFSSNTSSTSSPPGTVTCGVCGAVRFYRFVKQARKFNIYSCESCRKFISKMIKRLSYTKNLSSNLVCHKGQGMCHVPPIVRSQQWRLIRCAYGARCPACWLKMCLRSFQMPMALKNSLAQLLPKYMQGPELLFNSSLPLLTWQSTTDTSKPTEDSDNVRTLRPKPSEKPPTKPPAPPVSEIKRQKIDLKGPRVKHVCRSASIVLGQPLATFPPETAEIEKMDADVVEEKTIPADEIPESSDVSNEETMSNSSEASLLKSKTDNTIIPRREKLQRQSSMSKQPPATNPPKKSLDSTHLISIDFWESCDPEDINRSGFGLIASEPFQLMAVCFLCGSAGREKLFHCSLCCEPYHSYCLDTEPPSSLTVDSKFSWLCPRCTVCGQCGEPGGSKISCQKCHTEYHPECLSDKDKVLVCFKCWKCRDCGSFDVMKSVGNIPLCIGCFTSRKRVSCPLCRNTYSEEDTKMMECSKCKQWLHSTCEGLSDEYYYILSLLPESVEFLCSVCSKEGVPFWRKSVIAEMKYRFNLVLKELNRNAAIRIALKSNLNKTTSVKRQSENESEGEEIDRKITVKGIRNKVNLEGYYSVVGFDRDMQEILEQIHSDNAINFYQTLLTKQFPWYDSKTGLFDQSDIRNEIDVNDSPNDFEMNRFNDISDLRTCVLCKGSGDGLDSLESRLLYCGQNEWIHVNCALWSSEVYEDMEGALQNVHSAISRGKLVRCVVCKQKGASLGCSKNGCQESYHFSCARNAECVFLKDKTVFCLAHKSFKDKRKALNASEFAVKRSVYVELEKKKRMSVEINKVHFMVGSLIVKSLGKIVPSLSDHSDVIVPSGFVCSRLFWSTVEPWRLISYDITTSVLCPQVNTVVDKNFTVDHSLPKSCVERKLKEINLWQRDSLGRKGSDSTEDEENTGDLLSPELTNAILEELPHDLLDGISMQDIFPKLLNYEDILNEAENNLKDIEEETKNKIQKRPKPEILPQVIPPPPPPPPPTSNLNKTRPCSLTVSYKKLDPTLKKHQPTPGDNNNMYFHIVQVDGAYDSDCSDSGPSGNWQEEPVTCERCHCTYRTRASFTRHLDTCEMISTSDSEPEMQDDNMQVQETKTEFVLTSYSTYSETHSTKTFVNNQECVIPEPTEVFVQPEVKPLVAENNQGYIPMCVEQPVVNNPIYTQNQITLNQAPSIPLDIQQPLTIQSVGYPQETTPVISLTPQNHQLTINPCTNLLNSLVAQSVNVPVAKPSFLPQKTLKVRPKQRLISKKPNQILIPQGNSMIVQQVQNFIDPFQQQQSQNVQYVTTVAPTIQQPPVLQLQPDGNFVSLLPTVLIQQPRVVPEQIIVDSNGSLTWAAPQPIYYGFETIVQNTVMQSQQFLPTTVPGVLTANSSYSTTTQVFQSKLEPVLDVGQNSFVVINPASVQMQHVPSATVQQPPIQPAPPPPPPPPPPPRNIVVQSIKPPCPPPVKKQVVNSAVSNSINLPTAPFVSEQGIPTIVVTPTPKTSTSVPVRPMSRVLPILNAVKEVKKIEKPKEDPLPEIIIPEPPLKEALIDPEFIKPPPEPQPEKINEKSDPPSVKLLFQKQHNEGVYKISNNFTKSSTPSIQVVPLKPIKSKPPQLPETPKPIEQPEPTTVNTSAILYTIESHDGFRYSSTSISDLWTKVFEAVQSARQAHNMPPLPSEAFKILNNVQLLGLKTNGLKYLIEQLPGASRCTKYKPSFHNQPLSPDTDDDFYFEHNFGSVRCAPFVERSESNDMFGWLASKHRKLENGLVSVEQLPRRGTATHLPMAMRFRNLRVTSRDSVGVYRSNIHRRGLFCLRDIEAGEMVIEYAGEVIRSILTDKREKYYNSKGIGCYMFRIDDNLVVDATMKGNAARFINHSCDPNCYSKVVDIHGHKHIIIFALRKIVCGEELTYDYKFPFEDDKIPCTCGARRCRKFLN